MRLLLVSLLGLAATSCRASPSEPTRSWGSMREVMSEGQTQGRVSLSEVLDSDDLVGLGALEGLRGEIAILDGVAWIARVEDGELRCAAETAPTDQATLLIVTSVSAWTTLVLGDDVAPQDLDVLLGRVARQLGFEAGSPLPFQIEGELVEVEAHVLNGQCPHSGSVAPGREPLRRSYSAVRGRLIGYYAPDATGTLVHHGQSTHVHVIVEAPQVYVGHVDQVGVRAGAVLSLPER